MGPRTAESRSAKGSTLPSKSWAASVRKHLAGADPAGGQSEDNKIGWSRVERCAELAGLEALIDGETKLAQGLS